MDLASFTSPHGRLSWGRLFLIMSWYGSGCYIACLSAHPRGVGGGPLDTIGISPKEVGVSETAFCSFLWSGMVTRRCGRLQPHFGVWLGGWMSPVGTGCWDIVQVNHTSGGSGLPCQWRRCILFDSTSGFTRSCGWGSCDAPWSLWGQDSLAEGVCKFGLWGLGEASTSVALRIRTRT